MKPPCFCLSVDNELTLSNVPSALSITKRSTGELSGRYGVSPELRFFLRYLHFHNALVCQRSERLYGCQNGGLEHRGRCRGVS